MKPFFVGSLFSGVGGIDLGLERSIPGARTIWQVEKDPFARRVLEKHWPDAKRYEDVQEVGAQNLEPVQLLSGGFPCQDTSVAGKGSGIDGSRSGLWNEYVRIIRELRDAGNPPRFVVVENVPALRFRGLDRVLGDLAESGYDAVWDCIPAQAVRSPQRRDRIFVVARSVSDTHSNNLRDRAEREKGGRNHLQGVRGSQPIDDGKDWSMAGSFQRSLGRPAPWPALGGICRSSHGVPNRLDRLRCLGNAVVPQVAEVIGRVVVDLMSERGEA